MCIRMKMWSLCMLTCNWSNFRGFICCCCIMWDNCLLALLSFHTLCAYFEITLLIFFSYILHLFRRSYLTSFLDQSHHLLLLVQVMWSDTFMFVFIKIYNLKQVSILDSKLLIKWQLANPHNYHLGQINWCQRDYWSHNWTNTDCNSNNNHLL